MALCTASTRSEEINPSKVNLKIKTQSQQVEGRLCFKLTQWKIWHCGILIMAACLIKPSTGQSSFTVNATQEIYQGEEQKSINLTMLFPTDHDGSRPQLHIHLFRTNPMQDIFICNDHPDIKNYIQDDYKGRLQCSFNYKGWVDCSISNLKLNDSGTYMCIIVSDSKSYSTQCDVIVKATQHQSQDDEPEPPNQSRITVVIVGVVIVGMLITALIKSRFSFNTPEPVNGNNFHI